MNTVLTYSPRDFIQEIATELGITVTTHSNDYITRLTMGNKTRHVLWSNWDINPATADRIACDKSACYEILSHCQVPAIPHHLLMHPSRRQGWTPLAGTWATAVAFFEEYHHSVVIKPNLGTNGHGIYHCTTIQELEAATHAIFETSPDAALCPFYEIATEYRIFHINGKTPLIYGKTPSPDNWRHNLSQGATAFEVDNHSPQAESLKKIALAAAKAININFATIDIAQLADGSLMVMEINSGVQARQLLEQHPHLHGVVRDMYRDAVLGMFNGGNPC